MDLLHKVRILVGALARKPFTPRPEKVDLASTPEVSEAEAARRDRSALETQEPEVEDTQRVADLIARQRQGQGG